jgi:hypothetical protein
MTVEAMAEDGQVIDAEVDESEATDTLDSSERGSDESPAKFEAAPQCAGCHRRGVSLSLLENGKRYCDRCAQEVERLMGIGPLFPTAQTLPTHDAHEAHDGGAHDDHEHSDNHHYSHDDGHDGAVEAHEEPEYELGHEPDEHDQYDQYDERDVDFGETESADEAEIVAEAPDLDGAGQDGADLAEDDAEEPTAIAEAEAAASAPVNEPEPASEAAHELAEAPAAEAAAVESEPAASGEPPSAGDEARRSLQELASKVGQQNQEAAEAVHPLIPKPTTVSAEPLEEHALMERVEEQIRPPATEAAQPTPAAQPAASGGNELVAALAAERDRLLDQRRALEARFRADVEAIDDRLVHVESLLGSQGVAIAS